MFAATKWLIVVCIYLIVVFLFCTKQNHISLPTPSWLTKLSHGLLRPHLLLLRYAATLLPPFTSPPPPSLLSRPPLSLLPPFSYCCDFSSHFLQNVKIIALQRPQHKGGDSTTYASLPLPYSTMDAAPAGSTPACRLILFVVCCTPHIFLQNVKIIVAAAA